MEGLILIGHKFILLLNLPLKLLELQEVLLLDLSLDLYLILGCCWNN